MTTLSAQQIYDYSLQQIAAESFLDLNLAGQPVPGQELSLAIVLRLGSNNPQNPQNIATDSELRGKTRMTNQQITDFTTKYEIIAHQADTASGFSGTLFKDRVTGTYTLSFRSTEFAEDNKGGDWTRDGLGASLEIGAHGFAIAQLADAEAWFRQLRGLRADANGVTSALLPNAAALNVTGYSLGGHLAGVFTEAHAGDQDIAFGQATIFNAPGRGGLPTGVMPKMYLDGIYNKMNAANLVLRSGARTTTGGAPYAYAPGSTLFNPSVYDYSINDRYMGPVGNPNQGVLADIKSTWATTGMTALFGGAPGSAVANEKITQIYGKTDYDDITFTANAGIATTSRIPFFIEDQPLFENGGVGWVGTLLGLKNNDFGNTHSITLIADAARLTALLQKLDNGLSDTNAKAILSAGSNERGLGTLPLPLLASSGKAESRSLENALAPLLRCSR